MFQKVYLLFRREVDPGVEYLDLCDIYTDEQRANEERDMRAKRANWSSRYSYTVQEWEIQE